MRKFTFLVLVAALASTSAFAASKYRPYYGGSSGQVQTAPKNPSKPAVTEDEKKLAEDEKLDIRKMTERLKNGGSK